MIVRLKNQLKKYQHLIKKDNWTFYRLYRFLISRKGQKKIFHLGMSVLTFLFRSILGIKKQENGEYALWLMRNLPREKHFITFQKDIKTWESTPLVSLILPVCNSSLPLLKETIASINSQVYTNWELCIADDCSTKEDLKDYLKELGNDPKVKVVFSSEKRGVSGVSNLALSQATGDYCLLLNQHDVLCADTLYQNVKTVLQSFEDFIYADEDKVDSEGQLSSPYFKPDWSPDTILSRNYIGHFLFVKTSFLKSVGGFREGLEGAHVHDLILRLTEQTSKIKHIPQILYHKRIGSKSLKVDALKGQRALQEAIERRDESGSVHVINEELAIYSVRYNIVSEGKVSIIIPTKDKADVIGLCLESIFRLTTYENFEIIVLDNNSVEESFFSLMEEWKQKEPNRFRVKRVEAPFNFALLMNIGVSEATGDFVLLLNNDTEVLHADWLTALVEQSQRSSIGVVGSRLIFPNDTLQHAGIVLGLGEVDSEHPFVGASREHTGYHYNLKAVTNYSALTAACFIVKKSIYNEVGGFDEKFEVEFNDVDFCLKVKEAGYDNVYLPHVELYHYESISRGHPMKTKASYKRHVKEVDLFRSKWKKYIDNDPCYNPNLSRVFTYFELNVNEAVSKI